MDYLGTANTQFGFNLFKKLNKIKDGNIFFSPLGMSTAFGMLFLRNQGDTSKQLQKMLCSEKDPEGPRIKTEEKEVGRHVFHFQYGCFLEVGSLGQCIDQMEKTEEVHHQFPKILSELGKSTDDYEVKIANRLFGEKTYLFLQKYLDYVEKYYHASMEPVDFINAADESRKKINAWVESQTNEKVKDLLLDGSINSSTKLVVVNIVYFKGQWDSEFKKENTKEEDFWLTKNVSKSVPMMIQEHSFSYVSLEDLQSRILGIPYKNNNLSMFILLPDDVDGLEKIIDKLTPENLVEWTSPGRMEQRDVCLHLPRFEVEDSYDLEALLAALGMQDSCQELGAHSPGESSHSGLQAQKFLHKSFVAVKEEGTETSAGTGVGFVVTSAPASESFHCNHPFLFFIRRRDSDNVLFFGRYSSP
ncbi:serpin B13 [Erinaceus europaeus]|uniref:Serpin B13 n=1 Tax=Erinaceus europaeus TaxID=9365 RepID=A0ABM3W079_ERIEU|nr:serpin B13 [Erinaceus europaeus]XP_060029973.1 serpin B13 [Erinaceus europaeus]XP_060029974.1 serpin B13 [Erinaceus europaeus]XP_060029975.1 serpin B13 [Erinaceus europaeus]